MIVVDWTSYRDITEKEFLLMSEKTTIAISKDLKAELELEKQKKGETYDDVIRRLLEYWNSADDESY